MVEELYQTLKAIKDRDASLFVKTDTGYLKLNIQSATVENKEKGFVCPMHNSPWSGMVSKVSVVMGKSVLKGRICIPCTDVVMLFAADFPTMVNVIEPKEEKKPPPEEAKPKPKEKGIKGTPVLVKPKRPPVKVTGYRQGGYRRVYRNIPYYGPSLSDLRKTIKEDVVNDAELIKLSLTRMDAIIIARVAAENSNMLYTYMEKYYEKRQGSFQHALETGRNISNRQAYQIRKTFKKLEEEGLLRKNRKGRVEQI